MENTIICQCNCITAGAAKKHACAASEESSNKRIAAEIFRSACNGKGCGGCNTNFEKLVSDMITEGWKPKGPGSTPA